MSSADPVSPIEMHAAPHTEADAAKLDMSGSLYMRVVDATSMFAFFVLESCSPARSGAASSPSTPAPTPAGWCPPPSSPAT
jgi:hypothetical protein